MKARKHAILSFVVMLVIFVQMAMPGIAYADDGAPPETPPTEEAVDPGDGAPPETPPEGEVPPLPEILEQAPPETDVVVLNEDGSAEPLATQQAAEIIANSDPVWCPAGETPATDTDPGTPGNQNNCTPNQASITDLINYLQVNSISGAGTIFFQEGTYGGPESPVYFDAAGLPLLTDLGLEGGWDLVTGAKVVNGVTTFNVPVYINWAGTVSLTDIVVDLAPYTGAPMVGLTVATSGGDIALDNVQAVNNSSGPGAFLDTVYAVYDPINNEFVAMGAGDVYVNDSAFSDNQGIGLGITANGNVSLANVTTMDNGGVGVYVETCPGFWVDSCHGVGGNVLINNGDSENNSMGGYVIWANGDIGVYNSYAGYNGHNGLYADNCIVAGDHCIATGDVEIDNGIFEENADSGAYVLSSGDVSVSQVYASYNDWSGISLITYRGTGDVDLQDVALEENGDIGLLVDSAGNITLQNVWSYSNSTGALLINTTGTGFVDIGTADFNDNVWNGLYVESHGDITLFDVWANDNGVDGAHLVTDGTASIDISLSEFRGNGEYGLYAHSVDGDITLVDVNASLNGVKGAYLEAGCTCLGNIFVQDSTFFENGEVGLWAVTQQGNIELTDVTEDGNGVTGLGAFLKSYGGGLINVTDSVFADNTGLGFWIVGTNDVDVNNVTADGNGSDGALIESGWTFGCFGPQGINVTVTDGTYQNNGGYGFYVAPGPLGTLTLAGTINFAANAHGDYYLDLIDPCLPPPEPPEPPQPPTPPLPVRTVEVPDTGGTPVEIDCLNYGATVLVLPNGDEVRYGCPGRGMYLIHRLQEGELPGPIATGPRFVSAINISLEQDGQPVLVDKEGGYFVVSFKIPEGMEDWHFAILFWDPSANNGAGDWVELPPQQVGGPIPLHPGSDDGMLILRGVYREDGYVRVKVTFTGTFALIAR
ncbi:MAG: hypothetical protein ABWK53_08050 [Anaerolineales bacterium]